MNNGKKVPLKPEKTGAVKVMLEAPRVNVVSAGHPTTGGKDATVTIVEFSDYIQPNAALSSGDLDANSYQHAPYLDAQVKDRGYAIIKVAETVTFPMGIYSKKFKSLSQLPNGARIAVPNDPTNGGRALLLLQTNGLIKLRAGAGLKATRIDIADNPRKLKIVELDAAQIPRSLDDVDAAAINTNFAMQAGLKPRQDAIAIEDPHGPYANVIAIRTADKDKPWVAKLVAAYHSAEVRQYIDNKYAGAVITAW